MTQLEAEYRQSMQRLNHLNASIDLANETLAAIRKDTTALQFKVGDLAQLHARLALLEAIAFQEGWDIDLDIVGKSQAPRSRDD